MYQPGSLAGVLRVAAGRRCAAGSMYQPGSEEPFDADDGEPFPLGAADCKPCDGGPCDWPPCDWELPGWEPGAR